MKTIKKFRELKKIKTFNDRYKYLKLNGVVGDSTFGYDRYLNQYLYSSKRWKQSRDEVIIRDNGCDLGIEDRSILGKIIIHHMNPLTLEDVELSRDVVFDPEYLICTTQNTHNAIHYGDESILQKLPVERKKNDTCPWL
jgi:hypothetical protein